jgi:hypothetical protein
MSDFLQNEDDEFLTRVVVDPHLSKFYLYSSVGNKRTVDCDDDDQFTRVLDLIEKVVDEDIVAYAEAPVKIGL